MLNGQNPLLLFQFSVRQNDIDQAGAKIPVKSELRTFLDLPPIPFYLIENLTGIQVENEDKNVDIQSDTETIAQPSLIVVGSPTVEPEISQKGLSSNVTINLTAKKSSVLIAGLSSLIDLIFTKVSSNEYSISYFNGSTSIFRARLQSYQVNQSSTNDLATITIILTRGAVDAKKPTTVIQVPGSAGGTPLGQA